MKTVSDDWPPDALRWWTSGEEAHLWFAIHVGRVIV